ncbi:MAG: glutamate-1-semialdehyde 2,1-aminomutase [Candidatus Hadarchaeota archaeon]
MQSRRLYEKAKRLLPGGVDSPVRAFKPYPFFIERGRDARITDVDGNEYVDYCLAYGPLILGHQAPSVVRAVKEQLGRGIVFGIPNELEVKMAEKITKHVSCAEMVRFVNSGTEATASVVRLARACTNRDSILLFDGCYHGAHDHFLFGKKGPKSPGIPHVLRKNTLVASFNDIGSVEKISRKKKLAAIMVEPVMGNLGCIPPQDGFLQGLREICDNSGALLIFDEVITGFRLAMGGAQEFYRVEPDIATLGKIIGGGFPVGAFTGRKEIMKLVAPAGKVYQAGTFCGHPVTMAAGLATIETLEREKSIQKASGFAGKVADILEKELGFPVNRVVSMFQVFFNESEVRSADDARKSDMANFMRFHQTLLKNGVFAAPSQLECWFTSSAHSAKDLKITRDAISRAAEVVKT